ncbi:hypothetical protein C448_05948 [Halococcus morrhuae DSM 1307]|uniref:Uncharacterized protein n=1 Tax=Halococcus morrhuae DSM 1307 TaxID=931277 RepID=M0MLT9_HALMO|nr:hypothetical protein C448_05948 [Halococcus morrhuae DSM 1307]
MFNDEISDLLLFIKISQDSPKMRRFSLIFLSKTQPFGTVTLRIKINKQHVASSLSKCARGVDGYSGLPDTTFLI